MKIKAKGCFQHGLDLRHVRVIPDDRSVIVETVKELSSKYKLVISSGGIGPTHDDITYESIGLAMGRPLIYHEPTIQLMKQMMRAEELDEDQQRMALIPEPDEVIVTPGLWVPLVRVANILVFPGVPRLFQQMLDHWFKHKLASSGLILKRLIRRLVRTDWKESRLAGRLREIQEDVTSKGIEIGSYPKMLDDGTSYVILSLVGPEAAGQGIDETTRLLIETFDAQEV